MAYDIVADLMTKTPRRDLETGPDGEEPFDPYLEHREYASATWNKLWRTPTYSLLPCRRRIDQAMRA